MTRSSSSTEHAIDDAKVLIISVAARMAGMHPQTLRQYDRMGLVQPGRAAGGGRRYSVRDVALLREIQRLSQDDGRQPRRHQADHRAGAARRRPAAAAGRAGGGAGRRVRSGSPQLRGDGRTPAATSCPPRTPSDRAGGLAPASASDRAASTLADADRDGLRAGTRRRGQAAEPAGVADQAALAPVVVVEEVRAGRGAPGCCAPRSPSSRRPRPRPARPACAAGAWGGPGSRCGSRRRRRCTGSAARTGGPGSGSSASSNSVPTSRSPATSRSQSGGIDCSFTESGWYAQARNSAAVGSTGLAKPRKRPAARSRRPPPATFGATSYLATKRTSRNQHDKQPAANPVTARSRGATVTSAVAGNGRATDVTLIHQAVMWGAFPGPARGRIPAACPRPPRTAAAGCGALRGRTHGA